MVSPPSPGSKGLARNKWTRSLSWGGRDGQDRVVPIAVKRVGSQADRLQGVATDLEARGITGRVQPGPHAEASGGRGRRDQVHDDRVAEQGLPAPVLADEGAQE